MASARTSGTSRSCKWAKYTAAGGLRAQVGCALGRVDWPTNLLNLRPRAFATRPGRSFRPLKTHQPQRVGKAARSVVSVH